MSRAPVLTTVMPNGARGASSRVRVLDWLKHLDIDAQIADYSGLDNNRPRTLVRHPFATLQGEVRNRMIRDSGLPLLLSREASPFSVGGLEARLLRKASHGVYDFDDALFNDRRTGFGKLLAKPRKCEAAVKAADHVIAGNDYLADWAGSRNRQVTVIPSCVSPGSYRRKSSWTISDIPRLVWMGSRYTEAHLTSISGALLQVHRARGARLTVVSSPGQHSLGELDVMVDRIPWSMSTFSTVLSSGDVGLSPLEDSPYARGKCAYKLLQYAACALPVVGSSVGANDLALARFQGLAPASTDEWVDALYQLIDESPADRKSRGLAARQAVESHYSFDTWASTWRRAVLG